MDKQTALEILIANACCCSLELSCSDCPLVYDQADEDSVEKCRDFGAKELVEAVRVMKGGDR